MKIQAQIERQPSKNSSISENNIKDTKPPFLESARKREVSLAKMSLWIVILFLCCHCIRIVVNGYEMVQTQIHGVSHSYFYIGKRTFKVTCEVFYRAKR